MAIILPFLPPILPTDGPAGCGAAGAGEPPGVGVAAPGPAAGAEPGVNAGALPGVSGDIVSLADGVAGGVVESGDLTSITGPLLSGGGLLGSGLGLGVGGVVAGLLSIGWLLVAQISNYRAFYCYHLYCIISVFRIINTLSLVW